MSQPGDKFDKSTTAQEVVDAFPDQIKGRYVVVTGTSPGGLGAEDARAIATKQPKLLVIASRDQKKLDEARDDILKETPDANIKTVVLDLDSLDSVRKAAKEIESFGNVDVLINNAGIMMCPFGKTKDGFENQFGVNYLAPWLLTNLLVPSMLKTPHPRVVFLSSAAHSWGPVRFDDLDFEGGKSYDKRKAYGQSKTGNMLNAVALAEKYGKDGLEALSVHPGGIKTNLMRHMTEEDLAPFKPFMTEDGELDLSTGMFKSIPAGAATALTAAFDPRMSKFNGAYLCDNQVLPVTEEGQNISALHFAYATDKENAKRLWDLSNKLTGENF